jgi:hypothetical protein
MRGKGFIRARIELAGLSVALDRSVKLLRIERLEPSTKPRQLARVELFDGLFNVFGGGHVGDIALPREAQKGGTCRWVGGSAPIGGFIARLPCSGLVDYAPVNPPRAGEALI